MAGQKARGLLIADRALDRSSVRAAYFLPVD